MKAAHRTLLTDLLSLPTSPLNEHDVLDYLRSWASRRRGITLKSDAYGNLRLRLKRGGKRTTRPLVFSAHTDHPGFEAGRMEGAGRLRAVWRGHVEPRYFRGTGVRFFCDGKWIRGRIRSVATRTERGRRQVTSVNVQVARPVARGSIGMWDLPNPVIRGRRVYARGCDDVAGVAAVIAALDELHRGRGTVDVIGLFTRAEEIGFAGAITAGRSGLIPRRGRIVAVETSSEIPGVRMGDGPILRVGDRHAIFTPPLTAFCGQVARDLAKRDRAFKFQRKLMDAGTCESAALCALGFEATGLCLALGNYHNMDAKRRRIGPEYIHLGDFEMLVQWFVGLARSKREADDGDADFRTWIDRLERKWSERLVRTARRSPCK